MRQQMKTLEEKNELYMQQTISLEEDSKRVGSLKTQIEMYKTQIHDLHNKLMDTEKRSDKAEFDAQRAKEKLQSTDAENQVLIIIACQNVLFFRVQFWKKYQFTGLWLSNLIT